MTIICQYIDSSDIKEYIEKGYSVVYLKPCCLATKEVEDDSCWHIKELRLKTGGIDKENPRVEVSWIE